MVSPLALRSEQVASLQASHHDTICLQWPISQTLSVRIDLDSNKTFAKINLLTSLLEVDEFSRQLHRDGLGISCPHKRLANCDKYAGKLFL